MAMMVPIVAKPIGREIGEKLRQIALARGMTQGQVAANAHVSQPTVSQLFNGGTTDPPIGTVAKVCRVLGVTPDQVLGLTPLPIPEPAETSEQDLRQELASDRAKFQKMLDQLADRVDTLADRLETSQAPESPQPTHGARKRQGSRGRKAS